MSWSVKYTARAQKQLDKLDPHIRRRIVVWVRDNLKGCDNPRAHGKALKGKHAGKWRYRVGDYRIICMLNDGELVILALEVRHRSEAY